MIEEDKGIAFNIRLRNKKTGACDKFEVKHFKNVRHLHASYEYNSEIHELEFRESERIED